MRFARLMSLMLLAAFASAAAADPAPVPPAPAGVGRPTRVVVVNVQRIFKDMKETKSLSDAMETRRKELAAKSAEMRANYERLLKERADINPTHPDYRKKSYEIDAAKAEIQAWGVTTKADVERDQKYMVKNLSDKIEAAVGEVAQRNGIDIVLPDDGEDLGNIEDIPYDELRRLLGTRTPLYASKSADITELVIVELDKKFLADKK